MTPLYVRQDAIDALHKESEFWVQASRFMLEHGFWVLIDEHKPQVMVQNQPTARSA